MFKKLLEQVQNELNELNQALQGEEPMERESHSSPLLSREQQLMAVLNLEKLLVASFQLNQFQTKYSNVRQILKQQLNPSELTYHRYQALIEQVYLSALDNLEAAVLAKQSISQIDVEAIQLRLSQEKTSDYQSLQQRLVLYEQQSQRIDAYLKRNEEALTALDQVAIQLANLQTQAKSITDLETAINELTQLVSRTQNHHNSS